jgi:hypothetical protein
MRQASEKATTVPEVERGRSRRSTDRKTPGKSPPFRDIGVGISRISQEAAGHWRSMRIGNFCVRMMGRFTHAALLQIHQSLRGTPVALGWLLG